jgi:hypothetical protein
LQEALREDDAALGGDMRLRAEMSPAVIRMRSVLPIFENTVYRLRELRRFHRSGVGRTEIGTMSSEEFFRDFAERENILVARLSEVRTMLRMYARLEERSFGGLPSGNSPFDSAADPFGN